MVAQKGHTESAPAPASPPAPAPSPAPAPTFTSCRKNKSENASFVADLKDHFTEFIHRPMDEHKACIKSTYHKIAGKFSEKVSMGKKDEESAPLGTTVKN
ncbi:hypothetical protein LguiA_005835 [Lonicera macranthoides]